LGDERALALAPWRMIGPLAFAASDIALEDAGWFEGVMLCGLRAANEMARWRVNMKTTFRLLVLILLLVLAVLPGALCGSGSAVAGASGHLTVLDWPGFDDKKFWIDFNKKYPDVTVEFNIKPSDADIYGAIKLGDQADIIHPYTTWLKRWVDEGLVEEIDVTKLANWDKIPKRLKDIGRFNGKQYFIPWDVGFSSILYRTDRVTGTIDSWKALFDPQYKGHISMFDDGPSAVEVYTYIHKHDEHKYDEPNMTTEQLADKIRDEWIKQKKLDLDYWEDESKLVQAMADGNVWVAYAWPSAYAALKKMPDVKVAYANPIEGRSSWVGVYGILKGTKNYELALKFLDEKLSTTTANNVIDELSYGVANQEVWSSTSNPTLKELSLDDPSVLQRTNFPPELTAEQIDAWTEMWARVGAAH
jgi:spermidine/putrescine transport system substrate-binding protein